MKVRLLQLWVFLTSLFGLFYFGLSDIWISILIYITANIIIGNAMMHRYYGHKSFNMRPQFERLSRWLCHHLPMGSVIGWAYFHRVHHKHSDTDLDVHSPTIQGIWHIIISVWKYKISKKVIKDLLTPELLWWHKYYFHYHIILNVSLLIISPWILIFVYAIPNLLNLSSAIIIAIIPHLSGDAENSVITDILTFGEGKHKYHHDNPGHYKYGKYDLTGIFIEKVLRV
tara:strand:- start:1405 stop:2088 length:684 start_codon:yes stop_codon:yes gene_type:complete